MVSDSDWSLNDLNLNTWKTSPAHPKLLVGDTATPATHTPYRATHTWRLWMLVRAALTMAVSVAVILTWPPPRTEPASDRAFFGESSPTSSFFSACFLFEGALATGVKIGTAFEFMMGLRMVFEGHVQTQFDDQWFWKKFLPGFTESDWD